MSAPTRRSRVYSRAPHTRSAPSPEALGPRSEGPHRGPQGVRNRVFGGSKRWTEASFFARRGRDDLRRGGARGGGRFGDLDNFRKLSRVCAHANSRTPRCLLDLTLRRRSWIPMGRSLWTMVRRKRAPSQTRRGCRCSYRARQPRRARVGPKGNHWPAAAGIRLESPLESEPTCPSPSPNPLTRLESHWNHHWNQA